ncbi:MAG: hypothetical protein ACRDTT_10515 [Pseudonocardiaceae bacterium]
MSTPACRTAAGCACREPPWTVQRYRILDVEGNGIRPTDLMELAAVTGGGRYSVDVDRAPQAIADLRRAADALDVEAQNAWTSPGSRRRAWMW